MLDNHQKISLSMAPHRGKTLKTGTIITITQERFPQTPAGSILPNDHAEGNKHPCWCANTQNQIFDRISYGKYKVRYQRKVANTNITNLCCCSRQVDANPTNKIHPGAGEFHHSSHRISIQNRVIKLWHSRDEAVWKQAVKDYWNHVKPDNFDLEIELNNLKARKHGDIPDWYTFMIERYMPWKFTAPYTLAANRKTFIKWHKKNHTLFINNIKHLYAIPKEDIEMALRLLTEFKGFGTAAASGLLSILFPKHFATVDQFVVNRLRDISNLPERNGMERINPKHISLNGGVFVINILKRKAAELNTLLNTKKWTPRKIDMALWGLR